MKWAFFLVKGQNGRWIIQKALHVLSLLRGFHLSFDKRGRPLLWGGGGQKQIGKDKRESLNFQIKPRRKPKLSLIFILYPNKIIMKSCNAKETVKITRVKWKTKTIGLISKNQQQLCTCSTLFVHFFVVVLHDYNMKLPETSLLNVL